MKKIVSFALGLLLLVMMTGCSESDVKNAEVIKEEIKIGVIIPLSEQAAALGGQMQKVMQYRLREINNKLKEKGIKVVLNYEDGKCSSEASNTSFQKLTDVNQVKFVIGGACSSESKGFTGLLEEKGVIAISPTSSNPDLNGASKNFFSLSYSDSVIAEGLANELGKFGTVAILSEQTDFNKGLKDSVTNALTNKYPNTKIVLNEEFSKGNVDFRNILEKVKNASVEAVFFNSNVGVTTEALVRQLAEVKGFNAKKIGAFPFLSQNVLEIAPGLLEGMIVVDSPAVSSQEFLSYLENMEKEVGAMTELGNYYTASTLDALDLIVELALKGGKSEELSEYVRTGSFSGNIGKIEFGGGTFVKGINNARFLIEGGKAKRI